MPLHVTAVVICSWCVCAARVADLQIVGRFYRSFTVPAAHATSPTVVIGWTASVIGMPFTIGWRRRGLIIGRITGWWCRRIVNVVGSPFVIWRERFQDRRPAVRIFADALTDAHGAAAHSGCMVGLERLLQWFAEHLVIVDSRQPIWRCGGEIITGTEATALDERSDAEFFQTGSWWD